MAECEPCGGLSAPWSGQPTMTIPEIDRAVRQGRTVYIPASYQGLLLAEAGRYGELTGRSIHWNMSVAGGVLAIGPPEAEFPPITA